jgi:hypothetical protein
VSTQRVYKGLTRAQQEAFEQIATGNSLPPMRPRTRDVLLKRGMIFEAGKRVLGRDRFGAIEVPAYEVPTPEHIEWCAWCSAQVEAGASRVESATKGEVRNVE